MKNSFNHKEHKVHKAVAGSKPAPLETTLGLAWFLFSDFYVTYVLFVVKFLLLKPPAPPLAFSSN